VGALTAPRLLWRCARTPGQKERRTQQPLGGIALAVLLITAGWWVFSDTERSEAQAKIEPFYVPPNPLPAEPGTIIRTEPLGVEVPGAQALRMLYVSERPDGTPAA
jgi:hypothetical protein